MMEFKCHKKAADLPPEWNELAGNYFQQTVFLLHSETYNPCRQRYYLCFENQRLVSAAVVYSLRLDILTFIKLKSPLPMHIVGIPCSVSSQGIFGELQAIETLKKHIFDTERGFVLALNLEEKPFSGSTASGNTLPTIVFRNQFADWQNYISSLRSDYRRRINQINRRGDELKFIQLPCSEFTETMYKQYMEVFKKSSAKLERLGSGFFRHLPSEFRLNVCFCGDKVIGWNITLSHKNTLYFFLGGIDYKLNKTYNTYLRLLSEIVMEGIEQNSEFIDLGQTAEIPKIRMGGKPVPRYMEAHHSNVIFRKLLQLGGSLLEYKRKLENSHPLNAVSK